MEITVAALAPTASAGTLFWPGGRCLCRLGRAGIRSDKREGDGATPSGRFRLRQVLYRPDRLPAPPRTGLPTAPLTPHDGWCDDPADPAYNRPVPHPYPARHEILWRDDGLYDLLAVLDHNSAPVIPGAGSAIFLHVADPAGQPTAGCVALPLADLQTLLADCGPDAHMHILPAS